MWCSLLSSHPSAAADTFFPFCAHLLCAHSFDRQSVVASRTQMQSTCCPQSSRPCWTAHASTLQVCEQQACTCRLCEQQEYTTHVSVGSLVLLHSSRWQLLLNTVGYCSSSSSASLTNAHILHADIGDIVVGSVLGPSSQRANEARIASFFAGIPEEVPVRTVNR